jgi:hypothetical protein
VLSENDIEGYRFKKGQKILKKNWSNFFFSSLWMKLIWVNKYKFWLTEIRYICFLNTPNKNPRFLFAKEKIGA